MQIAQSLVNFLSQSGGGGGTPPLQLSFPQKLPQGLNGKLVSAEVVQAKQDGTIMLKTTQGQQFEAKVTPPLPQGSRISFTATSRQGRTVVNVHSLNVPKEVLQQVEQQATQPRQPASPAGNNQQPAQQNAPSGQQPAQQQQPAQTSGAPQAQPAANGTKAPQPATPTPQTQPTVPQQTAQPAPANPQPATPQNQPLVRNWVQQLQSSFTPPDLSTPQAQQAFLQILKSQPVQVRPTSASLPLPPTGSKLPMMVVSQPARADTSQLVRQLEALPPTPRPIPASLPPAVPASTATTTPALAAQPLAQGVELRFNPPLPVPTGTTFTLKLLGNQQAELGQIQLPPTLSQAASPTLRTAPQDSLPPLPLQSTTATSSNSITITAKQAPVLAQALAANPAPQAVKVLSIQSQPAAPLLATPTSAAQPVQPNAAPQNAYTAQVLLGNGTTAELPLPTPVRPGTSLFVQAAPTPATSAAQATTNINITLPAQVQTLPPQPLATGPQMAGNFSQPVGTVMVATISQSHSNGHHTLQLPQGQQVQVQLPQRLPQGVEITFQIKGPQLAALYSLEMPNSPPDIARLATHSFTWKSLQNALQTLQHQAPEATQRIINSLPQAGTNPLPALLAWQNAIQTQQLHKVMDDDTLKLLRAMGFDLAAEARNVLHQQPRLENQPQEPWRTFFFPYMDEREQLRQGQLYWRQERDAESNDHGTRFVLNLSLSNMGDVQLNGLMHHKTLNMHLHISADPGATIKQELRGLVGQTLEALGLNGGLHFRINEAPAFDPLFDILAAAPKTSVTI